MESDNIVTINNAVFVVSKIDAIGPLIKHNNSRFEQSNYYYFKVFWSANSYELLFSSEKEASDARNKLIELVRTHG